MNREQLAEQLDRNIDGLMNDGLMNDALMKAPAETAPSDDLLALAAELRLLPSDSFKRQLHDQLMERASSLDPSAGDMPASPNASLLTSGESAPSFSTREFAAMPADPRSLLLSFVSHVAVVALIASGIWVGHETVIKNRPPISELTFSPLPTGDGGGSGGDRSAIHASRGTPPEFSTEQLAPPAIVVRTETPKLAETPTVLGPPDLKLPQSNQLGDLVSSNVVMPSNGTGAHGGIGDNNGTGIGGGDGGGVGPGSRAGYGGGVFSIGNGITAPRATYNPDPEYSDEARRGKFQGNVVLSLIVDPTGRVRDIHVARSLGMGLDEKAIEAVKKWKFAPGMKDGHPVAVAVNVEVNFRLY
jgi:TonB family protein